MNHIALIGDSIFDNWMYVEKNAEVLKQLRDILPSTWQASLVAIDGATSKMAMSQVGKIPASCTHLFLSVGGNDALMQIPRLATPVKTVSDGLEILNDMKSEFKKSYQSLIESLLTLNKPLAVCTIYDAIPTLDKKLTCALSIFNDVILREAIRYGLPVLDLRMVCTDAQDFAPISPIEPSTAGGKKIAHQIVEVIKNHDFSKRSNYGWSENS